MPPLAGALDRSRRAGTHVAAVTRREVAALWHAVLNGRRVTVPAAGVVAVVVMVLSLLVLLAVASCDPPPREEPTGPIGRPGVMEGGGPVR